MKTINLNLKDSEDVSLPGTEELYESLLNQLDDKKLSFVRLCYVIPAGDEVLRREVKLNVRKDNILLTSYVEADEM